MNWICIMDDKKLIALQDRYKNALLYKQETKIHNLYDQLSKGKTNYNGLLHKQCKASGE